MRINERIDECVSLAFTGGPAFKTETTVMDSGDEIRNRRWKYPKHRYVCSYQNLRPDARDEIIRMIHVAGGSWLDFRFKDWMDYTATDEPLSPIIGTSDPVQLVKTYTKGSVSSERIVQAIVSAQVKRNGVAFAGTYDDELGLFTPDSAWTAADYTWSGEFDVWVHFTQDYNPFSASDAQHWSAPIELEESRQHEEETSS